MNSVFLAILSSFAITLSSMAEEPTVKNFQEVVSGQIYRGARPTEAQWKELKDFGIKTVISLQGGDDEFPLRSIIQDFEPGELPSWIKKEDQGFTSLGIHFENRPLNSIRDITGYEASEINEVLLTLQDSSKYPIFFHCEHGNDRTGLIAALYRVEVQGWTWQSALSEWKRLGHQGVGRAITYSLDEYFFDRVNR